LVTTYGQVSADLFLDPNSGRVFRFDHRKRKITEITEQKQVLKDDIAKYRSAIATSLSSYIESNYKEGKCITAVYGADNGTITVCVSAKNVHLGNFWTGGWRSVFSLNVAKPGSTEMKANVKINVHYFEDGNVQLNTHVDKTTNITVTSDEDATGKNIAVAIAQIESEFQSQLEEMYVNMHRTTFKSMRRFLPVSRSPMVWSLAAHSLASEVNEKDDKAKKELIKKSEEEFFGKYVEELSLFKRNFFASPYEKIFKIGSTGKLQISDKVEYAVSDNESVWLVPESDKINVFIGLNFDDITDKTIAKLILSEMEEAKKHVKESPSIQKMHADSVPDLLKTNFANSQLLKQKYSNGLIGITLFKKHYENNSCATMFAQLRQYLKYHIHASKTYLHGRIRRRVAQLQRTNNQAKFEEEGKKTYRSSKGKNVEVDLKEEEKGPQTLLKK